jgi:hypothetical protein
MITKNMVIDPAKIIISNKTPNLFISVTVVQSDAIRWKTA